MQFHFSFKHMESSESLQSYAEQKLREKIEKYVTKPIDAQMVFSVSKHIHHAHLRLKAGDGFSSDFECESGDMYATIDILAGKLDVHLKKHKEKLKEHKTSRSPSPLVMQADSADDGTVDAADILKYERARLRSR